MNPKKISVRPGNDLEGDVFVVWVYHRKAQIQTLFPLDSCTIDEAIAETVSAWRDKVPWLASQSDILATDWITVD